MDGINQVGDILRAMKERSPTGFAIALHVHFTTPRYLFQTYNRAWRDVYSQKGLVMQDPAVRWGFENEGIIDWSDLATDDPANVMGQAAEHGMRYGITIAVVDGDSRSIAAFSRGDRAMNEEDKADLHELFRRLHRATDIEPDGEDELAESLKRLSLELTHE